jgi:hypothetical protein
LRFSSKEASRKLEKLFCPLLQLAGEKPEANMEEGFIC